MSHLRANFKNNPIDKHYLVNERSGVQGAAGTGVEPLRVDELREERVHGGVAEFLQIREPQALGRDRVLSVQAAELTDLHTKTDGKKDECMIAQEKMHPACAQRGEGEIPTCHSLAETCKEHEACRARLEYYEQNCAVDSVTKKCAGPTAECRKAMLGILGTELRSNCACKGTELTQLYDCLGWQRLLWVNPCVGEQFEEISQVITDDRTSIVVSVESQKDYHARRKHHHYARTTTTTASSTTKSPVSTTTVTVVEQVEDNKIPEVTRWTTTEPTETWEITTISSTTISTTPSTTTTTTTPPRFCVVQRPRQSHQYIREGEGKRLYREDEPECSELCQCGEGEVLICNTICVDSSPCKTDFAFYNHEAPAYQAHRGPCLCYSGRFICMRPSPDAYSIPHGVFMFLGYSEKDESLLRRHNNLTVLDAVSSLDNFMREEVNNQTVCTLFLYNATRENVIAVARLGTDNPPLNSSQAQSLQHLLRVKRRIKRKAPKRYCTECSLLEERKYEDFVGNSIIVVLVVAGLRPNKRNLKKKKKKKQISPTAIFNVFPKLAVRAANSAGTKLLEERKNWPDAPITKATSHDSATRTFYHSQGGWFPRFLHDRLPTHGTKQDPKAGLLLDNKTLATRRPSASRHSILNFEIRGVRLDAAGSQRQDQQQAPRGPHAPAAVDLQDGRGRGQVAVQQRGRRAVEVVELPVGRDPPAAQPVSIGVDVPGRLSSELHPTLVELTSLESISIDRANRSVANERVLPAKIHAAPDH
ncbi:hypothetical protein WN51_02236 [Melipona quadrifasciata]|uniref:GDNF/GAS1 domain-containing protein n=1 Tax=Melipona quadrifasciata TaxID=166423 RepID=A0A0N0BDR5_9HYME|nr:hypothetical protein WN51_02236 [Melipona quadrifasciata]